MYVSRPCNRHELFLQMTNIHVTRKSISVVLYHFLNKAVIGHSLLELNAPIKTVHVMRKFLRNAAYNCVKSFSFTKQDQPRIFFKGTYFRRKMGNREDFQEILFMRREMYSPNHININLHN